MMLLQKWAKLQLAISIARTKREGNKLEHNVGKIIHVNDDNFTRSAGYLALRKWFESLSAGAQQRTRTWMSRQVQGVEQLKRRVEAEGDVFEYADLEFNVRRADNGEPIFDDKPEEQDDGNAHANSNGLAITGRYAQAAQARRSTDEARGGGQDR